MSLQIVWGTGSQPSRALKAFLMDAGIPHTERVVDLEKGEHKTPEITALNPAGTVPFLIEDGELLVETVAIMRYLSEKYPAQAGKLYSTDPARQYVIDKWCDFWADALRTAFNGYFQIFFASRAF